MIPFPNVRFNLVPVTRIEFGRIKGRGDGQRENKDDTVLGIFRFFFQQNENESTIEMQTSLSRSPLRSDGVDETGDANRTLVWVTRRTTGRGGQTPSGSILTHSLSRWNSRRAANAEREVNRLPEEMVVHRESRWDIPQKRALFTSDV